MRGEVDAVVSSEVCGGMEKIQIHTWVIHTWVIQVQAWVIKIWVIQVWLGHAGCEFPIVRKDMHSPSCIHSPPVKPSPR